jgi:putative PIN family toxin of toxin-antitoxin system
MRVVLDTNVYVSALTFPGGRGESALRLAIERRVEVLVSPPIVLELAKVLREKFSWEEEPILDACRLIRELATPVRPKVRLSVLSDEPDNRILECAVEGAADAIVTGDRHLLTLKAFRGVQILRLGQFLETF